MAHQPFLLHSIFSPSRRLSQIIVCLKWQKMDKFVYKSCWWLIYLNTFQTVFFSLLPTACVNVSSSFYSSYSSSSFSFLLLLFFSFSPFLSFHLIISFSPISLFPLSLSLSLSPFCPASSPLNYSHFCLSDIIGAKGAKPWVTHWLTDKGTGIEAQR